jgi:hypothetical protein
MRATLSVLPFLSVIEVAAACEPTVAPKDSGKEITEPFFFASDQPVPFQLMTDPK